MLLKIIFSPRQDPNLLKIARLSSRTKAPIEVMRGVMGEVKAGMTTWVTHLRLAWPPKQVARPKSVQATKPYQHAGKQKYARMRRDRICRAGGRR